MIIDSEKGNGEGRGGLATDGTDHTDWKTGWERKGRMNNKHNDGALLAAGPVLSARPERHGARWVKAGEGWRRITKAKEG
jgi:hypothetical protein